MKSIQVISIERQFGSGGRIIGSLLAERLGFQFYNEEILKMASENLKIPPEYLQHAEEAASSSLMYALSVTNYQTHFQMEPLLTDKLFFEESQIIKKLANSEKCIIVGRCAGNILRNYENCLRVFIYAHEESRIKRIVEQYGFSEKDALAEIHRVDKRRTRFYNAHAIQKWHDMETYDICLDSGTLGIERCVDLLATIV